MNRLFLLPLLLGVVLATPVRADEATDEEIKTLLDQLDEARKDEDVSSLKALVPTVPDLYKATETSGLQSKLCDMLGKIVKDDDLGDARVAAVDALVALDDPKDAWKELQRELPDPKADETTPIDIPVVKAAGLLAQTRAIKPLLELAGKARDKDVAKEAVLALGRFREEKRQRLMILDELMSIALRTRPGRTTDKVPSQEAVERWAAMEPAVIEALNTLTGQRVLAFDDWEAMFRENKRRPQELFID